MFRWFLQLKKPPKHHAFSTEQNFPDFDGNFRMRIDTNGDVRKSSGINIARWSQPWWIYSNVQSNCDKRKSEEAILANKLSRQILIADRHSDLCLLTSEFSAYCRILNAAREWDRWEVCLTSLSPLNLLKFSFFLSLSQVSNRHLVTLRYCEVFSPAKNKQLH
jgi:hypothetical protein